MIRTKSIYLSLLLFSLSLSGIAQTIKGYTKAEIDDYSAKVEDTDRCLKYLLNHIGSFEHN